MFPVFLLLVQPISWSLTTNVTNGFVFVCCSYQTLPCIFFLFVYTYFFYQTENSWRQELLSYSIFQNYTMETCTVINSVSKINLKGKNIIWSNHPWKALRKGQFCDQVSFGVGTGWCIIKSFICMKLYILLFLAALWLRPTLFEKENYKH